MVLLLITFQNMIILIVEIRRKINSMKSLVSITPLLMLTASAWLVSALVGSQASYSEPATPTKFLSNFGLKMPEIFSFAKFRQTYNKNYGSPIEESHRNKLFLPRAFQTFVSFAEYMSGLSEKYLSLNHMSDMTVAEREQLFMPPNSIYLSDGEHNPLVCSKQTVEDQMESIEDIERRFVEIEQHKNENPEYAQIAAQLEIASAAARKRKRRSTDGDHGSAKHDSIQASPSLLSGMIGFVKNPVAATKRAMSYPGRPDEVLLDHRQSNCFAAVKDQGTCSSCYIFSIMALFEYYHCKQKSELLTFSEQYVLDCGDEADDGTAGCRGSYVKTTAMFAQKFGLELDTHYPYSAQALTCPYTKSVETSALMGHTRVRRANLIELSRDKRTSRNIGKWLREKGPLIIGVKVDPRFIDYGGGVDRPKNRCYPLHAMVLVGEGIEGGQKYWLTRNSHGNDWGLDGYYKLSKNVDPDLITKIAHLEVDFGDKNTNYDERKFRSLLEVARQKKSK